VVRWGGLGGEGWRGKAALGAQAEHRVVEVVRCGEKETGVERGREERRVEEDGGVQEGDVCRVERGVEEAGGRWARRLARHSILGTMGTMGTMGTCTSS